MTAEDAIIVAMRQSKPEFNISEDLDLNIAIITASWNNEFNQAMAESAKAALAEHGIKETYDFQVPGALELPLMAQTLAKADVYNAILCFATIFRGETLHFELVAKESTRALMNVSLEYSIPIMNGILACENKDQAEVRASRDKEDKGREIALSAIALVQQIAEIDSHCHEGQG